MPAAQSLTTSWGKGLRRCSPLPSPLMQSATVQVALATQEASLARLPKRGGGAHKGAVILRGSRCTSQAMAGVLVKAGGATGCVTRKNGSASKWFTR